MPARGLWVLNVPWGPRDAQQIAFHAGTGACGRWLGIPASCWLSSRIGDFCGDAEQGRVLRFGDDTTDGGNSISAEALSAFSSSGRLRSSRRSGWPCRSWPTRTSARCGSKWRSTGAPGGAGNQPRPGRPAARAQRERSRHALGRGRLGRGQVGRRGARHPGGARCAASARAARSGCGCRRVKRRHRGSDGRGVRGRRRT
jgi:hypothetical protein